MDLDAFLAEAKLTHDEFGRRIGVTGPNVSRYASGLRFPRPATLKRIEEETAGRVTAADLLRNLRTAQPSPAANDTTTPEAA